MADVFLSYKNEDREHVRPLVMALEQAGFSVWWDARIAGGEQWRDAILQQLEAAACVIVAWSKRSVGPEGHFVRDEAARAQRRGVYLPVLIEPVEPPLGFGETQALSLEGWNGSPADRRYRAVFAAVEAIVGIAGRGAPSGDARAADDDDPLAKRGSALAHLLARPRRWHWAAIAGLLTVTAIVGFFWRSRQADAGPAIVLHVDSFRRLSPDLPASLPDSFRAELLNQLQLANSTRIQVAGEDSGGSSGYHVSGSISRSVNGARILLLVRQNGATLGSVPIDLNIIDAAVMSQQAGWLAASSLGCAFDFGDGRQSLSLATKQLLFRYCGTDIGSLPNLDSVRQLTERLPDVADAWSRRAEAAAYVYDAQQEPSYKAEAVDAARRALLLDSRNSRAFLALSMVRSFNDWAARERPLKAVTAARPMSGGAEFALYAFYGELLLETGRIAEATEKLEASAGLEPKDPYHAQSIVDAYRLTGQVEEADRIATDFRRSWPDIGFEWKLLRNAFTLHQPARVRSILDSLDPAHPLRRPVVRDAYLAAADALASEDRVRQAKAAGRLETLARDPAMNGMTVVTLLGLLGADAAAAEALERLVQREPPAMVEAYDPALAGARRQPAIARTFAKAGLIAFWRKSGNKPDFCKIEQLPAFCS